MRQRVLSICLILTFVVAACSQAATTKAPAAPVASAYPAPQSSPVASAYPAPAESAIPAVTSPVAQANLAASEYPAPAASTAPAVAATPYPGPIEATARPTATSTPIVVPTAAKDSGVVTGFLFLKGSNMKTPISDQTVKLGEKVFMTPGPAYIYGLSDRFAPIAVTDGKGQFAMNNVPPKKYIIMVWSPSAMYVVLDPKTGKELEITVEAGKVLDLCNLESDKTAQ
jgi:hypothetical protein